MYDAKRNGYNKTIGNHVDKNKNNFEKTVAKMHFVNSNLSKEVLKHVRNIGNLGVDEHEDNVLIIGQFACAEFFKYGNNVTVISDNLAYKCDGVEIIRVNDISKKYKEVLDNMKDKHFDLIIANPPYGKIGAEITKYVINNIDYKQFINLMPANDYTRVNNLINHVDPVNFNKADNSFDDANVIVWIANIVKQYIPMTKETFIMRTYDDKLMKCYETFANREHYAIDKFTQRARVYNNDNYNVENDFIIHFKVAGSGIAYASYRNFTNGNIDKAKAFEVKWNVLKNVNIDDIPKEAGEKRYQYGIIRFNTSEEKDNFTKFWYESKLMKILLEGLYAKNNSCIAALPKVDWTRPWTDEEILRDCGYTDDEIKNIFK